MDNRFKDECIAYGLACGLGQFGSTNDIEADAERSARRARWERRKAKR